MFRFSVATLKKAVRGLLADDHAVPLSAMLTTLRERLSREDVTLREAKAVLRRKALHKRLLGDVCSASARLFITSSTKLHHPSSFDAGAVRLIWWRCPAGCGTSMRRDVAEHLLKRGECDACGARMKDDEIGIATPKVDSKRKSQKTLDSEAGRAAEIRSIRIAPSQADTLDAKGVTRESIMEKAFFRESSVSYLPMLAERWSNSPSHTELQKVWVSPKLDGIRCVVALDGSNDEVCFFSRMGTILECGDHLLPSLRRWFAFDSKLVLDGELYEHTETFESLNSAVRTLRENITPEVLAVQKRLQYHIFDVMHSTAGVEKLDFGARLAFLNDILVKVGSETSETSQPLVTVVPAVIVRGDEVQDRARKYTDEGYEGAMVRIPQHRYEHGRRSKALLKVKSFFDSEFLIDSVIEGKGRFKNSLGSFKCIVEKSGALFQASPTATAVCRKAMWQQRSQYPGKMLTVQYQSLGADGVPRFPVAKAVRGLPGGSDWL